MKPAVSANRDQTIIECVVGLYIMCFKDFLFDIKKVFLHPFRLNIFEEILIVIAVFKA